MLGVSSFSTSSQCRSIRIRCLPGDAVALDQRQTLVGVDRRAARPGHDVANAVALRELGVE